MRRSPIFFFIACPFATKFNLLSKTTLRNLGFVSDFILSAYNVRTSSSSWVFRALLNVIWEHFFGANVNHHVLIHSSSLFKKDWAFFLLQLLPTHRLFPLFYTYILNDSCSLKKPHQFLLQTSYWLRRRLLFLPKHFIFNENLITIQ